MFTPGNESTSTPNTPDASPSSGMVKVNTSMSAEPMISSRRPALAAVSSVRAVALTCTAAADVGDGLGRSDSTEYTIGAVPGPRLTLLVSSDSSTALKLSTITPT